MKRISIEKREKYVVGEKRKPKICSELFDSIAPQNAETHTAPNSLPLNSNNSAKNLFFN